MKTTEILTAVVKAGYITEQQINVLKRRANAGEKIEFPQTVYDGDVQLTEEQTRKGFEYLYNLWKTPNGKERKNNPFGYREQDVLKGTITFYFDGFHNAARYGQAPFYVPIYTASANGSSFQYYVCQGIQIIG
jgi:hypothetical protein